MSAWRIVVQELYERGGSAAAARLPFEVDRHALERAIRRRMVQGPGKGSNGAGEYRLTDLGLSLAQNRVVLVPRCPSAGHPNRVRGSDLVARPTWLASLPDDIRLNRSPA